MIVAAAAAVLSLAAVGVVMAMAFNNAVSPAWITSTALYGLPLAFLLMLLLVIDGRERQHSGNSRNDQQWPPEAQWSHGANANSPACPAPQTTKIGRAG